MTSVSDTERGEFIDMYNVSRETLQRLDRLVALLQKWTPVLNLTAKSTMQEIWLRHISDSFQLTNYIPKSGGNWLDIGTGGGFPGLVIAIAAEEKTHGLKITLVEGDHRKCVFLETAIRELGISAVVKSKRIEHLEPHRAQIISARAVAPLAKLLDLSTPHLAPDGICLFLKGQNHLSELTEARRYWKLDCEIKKSRTDPRAAILIIHEATRV